jgi:hypothetical protein
MFHTALTRSFLVALATVIAIVATMVSVPTRVSATSQVPFHATITETVTGIAPCPLPVLCASVTGTGQATSLGATRESLLVRVDTSSNPAPGCHTEVRTSILTAANGDQITLQGPGQSCGVGTPHGTAFDSWAVIAGTGRFSGATGSGTNSVSINGLSTAVTTFSGTISSPGSLR